MMSSFNLSISPLPPSLPPPKRTQGVFTVNPRRPFLDDSLSVTVKLTRAILSEAVEEAVASGSSSTSFAGEIGLIHSGLDMWLGIFKVNDPGDTCGSCWLTLSDGQKDAAIDGEPFTVDFPSKKTPKEAFAWDFNEGEKSRGGSGGGGADKDEGRRVRLRYELRLFVGPGGGHRLLQSRGFTFNDRNDVGKEKTKRSKGQKSGAGKAKKTSNAPMWPIGPWSCGACTFSNDGVSPGASAEVRRSNVVGIGRCTICRTARPKSEKVAPSEAELGLKGGGSDGGGSQRQDDYLGLFGGKKKKKKKEKENGEKGGNMGKPLAAGTRALRSLSMLEFEDLMAAAGFVVATNGGGCDGADGSNGGNVNDKTAPSNAAAAEEERYEMCLGLGLHRVCGGGSSATDDAGALASVLAWETPLGIVQFSRALCQALPDAGRPGIGLLLEGRSGSGTTSGSGVGAAQVVFKGIARVVVDDGSDREKHERNASRTFGLPLAEVQARASNGAVGVVAAAHTSASSTDKVAPASTWSVEGIWCEPRHGGDAADNRLVRWSTSDISSPPRCLVPVS